MNLLPRTLGFISRIGATPDETEDMRLQRNLLMLGTLMFIFAGALWGVTYMIFGEVLAGSIPFGYSVFSALSVVIFAFTRRYRFFRFSQLLLILLLPFFLMIALGGFINSSAVILWAFICPLGALLFDEPRNAPRWFLAYLGVIALSGIIQPHVRLVNNLSTTLITVFFVMNLGGVSTFVFVLVSHFVGQKNIFQEKAEALLLNVLPKEIAQILKYENRTIADHYDEASILFADMVNFTPMSAEMSPVAMVELLNEVFTHFDGLVEKYDLEKIKTVGDCYMVAAAVPRKRMDHAQSLVRLALEMREFIHRHTFNASRPVDFRIGINSGPVLAGVIGRKKFIYDLWGDAVNIASRMESHGYGGVIQITRATYELIKDQFVCHSYGTVNVKGKGEMEVWHVMDAVEGTDG
ncbi:MAG: adenylate/guanylate cyclase domain-containing protein [Chloroflexi bacterium]|nr:adenylate/guanylate cyclase domain-containing protein [Chloroflexota bacterium]